MFPRRYYPGRFYAPRYFPQSKGDTPTPPTSTGGLLTLLGVG